MAKKKTSFQPKELSQNLIVGLYVATLAIFFASSFFTDQRLWGFSSWGYLPVWARAILLLLGLAALPIAIKFLPDNSNASPSEPRREQSFLVPSIVIAALLGFSFWLLRGATHFLGDGYTNLSTLSAEHPIIKGREIGETILHLWLAGALGGANQNTVLLSYQIISIFAGLVLVLVVTWSAAKLFEKNLDRLLFALGILTAGQMLLFFGYVENYSLFVLSVGVFTCLGVLIARRKLPRLLILITVAFAIFFHILGVTLIPAALYLMIAGTKFESRIERLSTATQVLAVALLIVLAESALLFGLSQSLFFRIALLSLTTSQFTIAGYTLFCQRHLVDIVNLIFLLLPGFLIIKGAALTTDARSHLNLPEYRFLMLLLLSVLGAAFIFDPKLGMPRDWDLYSFPAIPIAVLTFIVLLDRRFITRRGQLAAALVIVAGLLTLTARVVTQAVPKAAVQQINDYISLDKIKGKNATVYLQVYYLGIGDTTRAVSLLKEYESFPDERLYRQMDKVLAAGDYRQGILLAKQAAQYNPMSSQAYAYMGSAYLHLGQVNDAVIALNTSLALNPHNAEALTGLGFIYFHQGKGDLAEQIYLQAAEYDPNRSDPFYYLSKLYQERHLYDRQLDYLVQAIAKQDASAEMFADLTELYLAKGQPEKAAKALSPVLQREADSASLRRWFDRFPQLKPYFAPSPTTR